MQWGREGAGGAPHPLAALVQVTGLCASRCFVERGVTREQRGVCLSTLTEERGRHPTGGKGWDERRLAVGAISTIKVEVNINLDEGLKVSCQAPADALGHGLLGIPVNQSARVTVLAQDVPGD